MSSRADSGPESIRGEDIFGVPNPTANRHLVEDVELVLPATCLERIRRYLFQDLSREFICHLLCGHVRLDAGRLRLLACYLVVPQPEHYRSQGLAGLALKPQFDRMLRAQCLAEGLSLVDIHSHPFSDDYVGFSGIDDADELEKFGYFRRNLPESTYASIVMGRSSQDARVYLPSSKEQRPRVLPLRLLSRDRPLTGAPPDPAPEVAEVRFDRQIRAFGAAGQAQLGRLKVGLVGAGGLGSMLGLGLTRLGVRRFVLIDPDRVEISNLNRLAGARAMDAMLGRPKVQVLAERMLEIDPGVALQAIDEDVISPLSWSRLRDCDLLVAATDNYSTRMLLNQLAYQYVIPLISAGVGIQAEHGRFRDANAEIHLVVPGEDLPCLLCSQTINKLEAYYELASPDIRSAAAARGYIRDFAEPAPAVYHLNGIAANLALVEIHNLVCAFKGAEDHLFYWMSGHRIAHLRHRSQHCAVCAPDGGIFGRGDQLDPVVQLFPGAPSVALGALSREVPAAELDTPDQEPAAEKAQPEAAEPSQRRPAALDDLLRPPARSPIDGAAPEKLEGDDEGGG